MNNFKKIRINILLICFYLFLDYATINATLKRTDKLGALFHNDLYIFSTYFISEVLMLVYLNTEIIENIKEIYQKLNKNNNEK